VKPEKISGSFDQVRKEDTQVTLVSLLFTLLCAAASHGEMNIIVVRDIEGM
jgi:hypothetical protein